jgi:hypothetical protein
MAGDPEASLASSEPARRLDPQGPMATLTYDNLANAFWETGRYEAELEASRRLLAARPAYPQRAQSSTRSPLKRRKSRTFAVTRISSFT